jgi:ABC-2 type transport system ATP-binding protein
VTAAIEARGLLKRYGPVTAVDHVDLTVRTGDVYGYLGPNGAGKTTSLRMLLGLIRPDEGTAQLFGRDPLLEGARALDGVAGFVEAPRFYPYLSGRKNLELVAALDGGDAAERIDDALHTVDLHARAKDKVGGYSHGMKQRLGIAGALLRDPKLLLLDEPTTGLDPAGMRDMRALVHRLAENGLTVLLSSHLMDEVEDLCDRVAIVSRGRVVYEGQLDELISSTGGRYSLRTTNDRAAAEIASRAFDVTVGARGLEFAGDERAVAALTLELAQADIGLLALVPHTATLEELFFRMTEGAPACARMSWWSRGRARRRGRAPRGDRASAPSMSGRCASCSRRSAPTSASGARCWCR